MSLILTVNTNIVVLLCTEWLTLQSNALLECCSQGVQQFLVYLSEQYISRFGLLIHSDMVVPITWSSVMWLEHHFWNGSTSFEFTDSTLTMIKQALSPKHFPNGSLTHGMTTNSILANLLKGIKRMTVSVHMPSLNEAAILLQNSCENLEDLHIRDISSWTHFFLNNLPCGARLISLKLAIVPVDMCSILRQTVNLQSLNIGYCVSLSFAPTMVKHNRNLTSFCICDAICEYSAHLKILREFLVIAFHSSKSFVDLELPRVRSLCLRSFLAFRVGTALNSFVCCFMFGQGFTILQTLANVAPQLTSLTPNSLYLSTSIITLLHSRFTQLKVLNLGQCSFDAKNVELLLTGCPQVSEINFSGSSNDETFTSLLVRDNHPGLNIRHLSIAYCYLTDSTLLCLPRLFPLLTSLDVSGTKKISDAGLLPILQTDRLQKLIINNTSLTEITLRHFAVYCSELKELHMHDIKHTEEAMLEVVRCCRRLKILWCRIPGNEGSGSAVERIQMKIKTINPRLAFKHWY